LSSVESLSSAVEFWKNFRVALGVVAIIAAAFAFVAQYMELRRSRELAARQREINSVRDEQLARDLKDKDLKIAEANERTEQLRIASAKLQSIIRSRRLPMSMGDEMATKYAALRSFAGTPFVIFVVPDFEAQIFANDVVSVLSEAKWTPSGVHVTGNVWSGIYVYSGHASGEALLPGRYKPDEKTNPGVALAVLINSAFATQKIGTFVPISVSPLEMLGGSEVRSTPRPPDAIVVTIGVRDSDMQLWTVENAVSATSPHK
jgi:hypothetical protein